jgi:hypothetical protein
VHPESPTRVTSFSLLFSIWVLHVAELWHIDVQALCTPAGIIFSIEYFVENEQPKSRNEIVSASVRIPCVELQWWKRATQRQRLCNSHKAEVWDQISSLFRMSRIFRSFQNDTISSWHLHGEGRWQQSAVFWKVSLFALQTSMSCLCATALSPVSPSIRWYHIFSPEGIWFAWSLFSGVDRSPLCFQTWNTSSGSFWKCDRLAWSWDLPLFRSLFWPSQTTARDYPGRPFVHQRREKVDQFISQIVICTGMSRRLRFSQIFTPPIVWMTVWNSAIPSKWTIVNEEKILVSWAGVSKHGLIVFMDDCRANIQFLFEVATARRIVWPVLYCRMHVYHQFLPDQVHASKYRIFMSLRRFALHLESNKLRTRRVLKMLPCSRKVRCHLSNWWKNPEVLRVMKYFHKINIAHRIEHNRNFSDIANKFHKEIDLKAFNFQNI